MAARGGEVDEPSRLGPSAVAVEAPVLPQTSPAFRPSPTERAGVRLRREWLRATQGMRDRWRSLERRYWPGARGTTLITAGVLLIVVALVLLIVLGHFNWWSPMNRGCEKQPVGCHLATHFFVDVVLAGVGIWWFLRGEAAAARSWRKTVRQQPERLFLDWLPNLDGLTGAAARALTDETTTIRTGTRRELLPSVALSAIGRKDLAAVIINDLNETGDAQIIVGDSGAGKTTLLLVIAKQLAEQGQVPVAITLRDADKGGIEERARRTFISTVTGNAELQRAGLRRARAKDDDQAEKWWNWLRRRSLITVLVDDLEKDHQRPNDRVQALEGAAHQDLRLVVASRSYGLPADYRRGRHEISVINPDEITTRLVSVASRRALGTEKAGLREKCATLVAQADLGRTPYYLALALVLANEGLLTEVKGERHARVALLDCYREALLSGSVAPEAGMGRDTRAAVLSSLEVVAYVRILGTREEVEVAAEAAQYGLPEGDLRYEEIFDLSRRLTILESRYDGEVHFAHPTTLAYFAARFVQRESSGDEWRRRLAESSPLTPAVTTALFLAVAGDDAEVRWACEELLSRIRAGSGGPAAAVPGYRSQENLSLCAAAAEMLATIAQPDPDMIDRIAAAAQNQTAAGERLIGEKRRVVGALYRLKAYDQLWHYAVESQEYPVRREASRLLVEDRAADSGLIDEARSAIKAAVKERDGNPEHSDDKLGVIERLKPVAWILPTLRLATNGPDELNRLQGQLIDLSLDKRLTVQRGLEASVAQGLKAAAHLHPGRADPSVEAMLDHRNGPPEFWFSRVLLLQALSFQCASDRRDTRQPEGNREAVSERLREYGNYDPHPFVKETARLCRLAVQRDAWERYVWTDVAETVSRVPPPELSVEAAQLAGDIVLALNLNAGKSAVLEKANRHAESAELRRQFGEAMTLPACLRRGGPRDAILGESNPPEDCPLAIEASDTTNGSSRCACPYLYNSTDLRIENHRELSRAFCRHQRAKARPLRWQDDLDTEDLKRFWERVEGLARF
jgi:hypothetical protein